MSGNLRVDTSGLNWSKIKLDDAEIERGLGEGAEIVLTRAKELTPYAPEEARTTPLRDTASVKVNRGGPKTVAIVYDSVYARWVHEHLHFRHPHGGGPKFLETALHEKGAEAMRVAAQGLLK